MHYHEQGHREKKYAGVLCKQMNKQINVCFNDPLNAFYVSSQEWISLIV